MSPLRVVLTLHLLLVAGLFAWSLSVRHELPAQLPVHFASDGTPNGWAETSALTWMAMPLACLGVFLLIGWGGARMIRSGRRHPRWLNLPRKQVLLSLPPERQEPVWRILEAIPAILTLPVQGLLAYGQVTIHRAAVTGGRGLAVPPVCAFLAVEGALLVACLVAYFRALRRAQQGAQASSP
jgi:hypothetical protein